MMDNLELPKPALQR